MTGFKRVMAATFLLVGLTGAIFGVSVACPGACSDDTFECSTLCLDCVCCPNGSSTPGGQTLRIVGLVRLDASFERVLTALPLAPPGEILHVPKPSLI